ncbi:hypothetical protein Ciccas_006971 [Cichlidogyrus casuarinus]|uniref:Uncharacterized protein n=1 Tax=Cichlidogyrus casuarinus TaxID=1844966 RepID=A0ABD2Q479_9PLAT
MANKMNSLQLKPHKARTFDDLLEELFAKRDSETLNLQELVVIWDKLEEISIMEKRKSMQMLEYLVEFIQIGFEIMPSRGGAVQAQVRYLLNRLSYYLDRRWSPKIKSVVEKCAVENLPSKAATRSILKNGYKQRSLSPEDLPRHRCRSMPEVIYITETEHSHGTLLSALNHKINKSRFLVK